MIQWQNKRDIVKLLSNGNIISEIAKKSTELTEQLKYKLKSLEKWRKTDFKNVTKRDLRIIKSIMIQKNKSTSKKILEQRWCSKCKERKDAEY